MAIAPLEELQRRQVPGRPPLRLVPGGRPSRSGAPRHARAPGGAAPATTRRGVVEPALPRPVSAPEAARRHALAAARHLDATRRHAELVSRRRCAVAVAGVIAAVVLLALPLRSLAAVTTDGRVTPGGAPAGLAPGSVYVVPPNSTLHEVAVKIGGAADAASMARAIVAETGSSQLVPGEHLLVP